MADTSKRGFASMDEDKQREIASKGGHAAHEKGTAHEFTSEEAREAGRKGGEAVSQDREHMAEIGSKGGKSSHKGSKSKQNNESGDEENDDSEETSTRGGTPEQHSKAGKQSHKNK
ncbi:stress-induced protein [Calothrix sp. FACHB-1219]|uniref:KGG domain-containing protein n=1 Tax=unclassified Calothrix TaxID=2619626 RepID=UPI001686DBBC|nr:MULTISPECIES: KGG domain-containing protein [unclassified Calothrix]MBD2201040.1 stress-induced protein [Calothrix sp. FACHB-168]MBD2215473.1 stress-induced protein [Calothrix sp. FACHB-1219]